MRHFFSFVFAVTFSFFITNVQASDLKKNEKNTTDTFINNSITTQFKKNINLNTLPITVVTQSGIVILTGNVKDKQAFAEALQLVFTTKGVKSVDIDNLEINHTNTTINDAYITAKIETAVLKAKILDDESIPLVGINATTVNGIVTITGEVKRNKSIIAILKRANAVHGVKKIISSLHVGKAE